MDRPEATLGPAAGDRAWPTGLRGPQVASSAHRPPRARATVPGPRRTAGGRPAEPPPRQAVTCASPRRPRSLARIPVPAAGPAPSPIPACSASSATKACRAHSVHASQLTWCYRKLRPLSQQAGGGRLEAGGEGGASSSRGRPRRRQWTAGWGGAGGAGRSRRAGLGSLVRKLHP